MATTPPLQTGYGWQASRTVFDRQLKTGKALSAPWPTGPSIGTSRVSIFRQLEAVRLSAPQNAPFRCRLKAKATAVATAATSKTTAYSRNCQTAAVMPVETGRDYPLDLKLQGSDMKFCLFMVTALLLCLTPQAQAKRAPNLKLKDLAGNTHKISDLRGSIAVINFWATWCAPCRDELPLVSRLSEEYGGKKVRFIALSADGAKDRAKVDQFLSHNHVALEIWVGADVDMMESAGLGNVFPATLILDEQGEIVTRVMGEAREEDIRKAVDWLLGGKAGAPPTPSIKRY
jgi:thiol-disulfide isomerase/thioredoxin